MRRCTVYPKICFRKRTRNAVLELKYTKNIPPLTYDTQPANFFSKKTICHVPTLSYKIMDAPHTHTEEFLKKGPSGYISRFVSLWGRQVCIKYSFKKILVVHVQLPHIAEISVERILMKKHCPQMYLIEKTCWQIQHNKKIIQEIQISFIVQQFIHSIGDFIRYK